MFEDGKEKPLLMAVLMLTEDDVLTCAEELGMSKEQITGEVIELVKELVKVELSESLGGWRELIKGVVKEALTGEAIECPLGIACSPSCAWREVGKCALPTYPK